MEVAGVRQEEILHVLRCIGRPATTREVAEFYFGHEANSSDVANTHQALSKMLKWGEIERTITDVRKGPHPCILWRVVE